MIDVLTTKTKYNKIKQKEKQGTCLCDEYAYYLDCADFATIMCVCVHTHLIVCIKYVMYT
jgi:hypothetical protein